jgi:DNA-binding XRE family transcriptional regulator
MESSRLGSKIRELHQKLELPQDNFARNADVAYTTPTKIEMGVIKNPSVFVVDKITKALSVAIEDLIK